MSSPLSSAITSEEWERVVQLCNGSPKEAKKWTIRQGLFEGIKDANVLPIHEALVAGAPYRIIEALIHAYPNCVFCKEGSYQRLALHCACRKNAVPEVVDMLLRQYADAALTPDSLGRLPLHYALSNGANPPIIDCLLKHRPNSARGFDKRGWTPLHVACGVGANVSVIKSILDCYPEAVLMRTNKGSTAKQCLSLTNAANKGEVKRMLQHVYSQVEQRYRPAQLIESDRELV